MSVEAMKRYSVELLQRWSVSQIALASPRFNPLTLQRFNDSRTP
jgi:hypothetical protein